MIYFGTCDRAPTRQEWGLAGLSRHTDEQKQLDTHNPHYGGQAAISESVHARSNILHVLRQRFFFSRILEGLKVASCCLVYLLILSGCKSPLPEALPGLDTANCDPATRADCVSVSEAFVAGRLAAEEKIVRLLLDLKSCRRSAP